MSIDPVQKMTKFFQKMSITSNKDVDVRENKDGAYEMMDWTPEFPEYEPMDWTPEFPEVVEYEPMDWAPEFPFHFW